MRILLSSSVMMLTCLAAAACGSSESTGRAPSADTAVPADLSGTPNASKTPGTPGTKTSPAPSKGCNGGAAKANVTSGLSTHLTLSVNGSERSYDLAVPPSYDASRAYPLVFVFHGSGGSGEDMRHTFGFDDIAGDKAVFVYPNGQDGHWNLESPADENADIAFFEAMVSSIEATYCIDDARVFATGYSNGAYFSNQLACRRGDALRAIAPHAGGGPFGPNESYDHQGNHQCAGKPPAVMVFHGEADWGVTIDHGQSSLAHWKWANGCSNDTTPRAPSACVAFNGCQQDVVWCSIPDQDHSVWSEGPKATWDFFASF